MNDTKRYVLICGNPVDSFFFFGPFDSHEDAVVAGEGVGFDWWIAELQAPTE